MDFDKFTERSRGFVQAAQARAASLKHQEMAPEHLLGVLLDDEEGLAANLMTEAGADPNTKQQGGWTALHAAAKHGDTTMTQLLLNHSADPNIRTDDGAAPRDLISANSPKAIRDLLDTSSIT